MNISINDKISELTNYFVTVLGMGVSIQRTQSEKLNQLPFFMSSLYVFGETTLFNRKIMLMFIINNEISVDKIRKHVDIAQNIFNTNVVAIIGNVEAYTRKRLIEKKVSFIVPEKQMYLPNLLIDLKEYVTIQKEQSEFMPPAAQCLFLYLLQAHSLANRNMKSIAETLQYIPMTITRAALYLRNAGLCEINGTKDKFLHFNESKRELWNKAQPLLTNPVKKTNYYTGWIKDYNLRKTNINALAHFSDINDDPVEYYAVNAGHLKKFEGVNLSRAAKGDGNICVEEWKYNPVLLSKTEFVDPLSLYLSLRNNPDERIEMALEQLIESIPW